MKINLNVVPYVVIAVLIGILVLQRTCNKPTVIPAPINKVDTVVVQKDVHDTIVQASPVLIKTIRDTIWLTKIEYKPDSNYKNLVKQYTTLADLYFAKNIYQKNFPLGKYGYVTVTDSVSLNKVLGSKLVSNIYIPTDVVEVPVHPKAQVFVGAGVVGTPKTPINGVTVNALLKTKKDNVIGAFVGYNGALIYGASYHWEIKF
jgi:hypothetical protein